MILLAVLKNHSGYYVERGLHEDKHGDAIFSFPSAMVYPRNHVGINQLEVVEMVISGLTWDTILT